MTTAPFDQEAPTLPPPEGAPAKDDGEVWFPKGKSRGAFIRIREIGDEKATIERFAKGEEPHVQTIRLKTLHDRYEKDHHA